MTNTTTNIPGERDLIAAFNTLKKEKNAVLLAHYYQDGEIQDMADFIGDSLALAQQAAKTDADIIVFSGVVFMGETAKIVSPGKKVLVPDMNAGCSLADNCPADEFSAFIAQHPGHTVVSYVNCSAEVKALSDILCTSTNAEKIIRSIPEDTPIIFGPDKHLGSYLAKKLGRPMVLWNGSCMVHELFDEKRIVKLQALHPEAEVIAHPECPEAILAHATHIGSTSSLLEYTKKSAAQEFIVVTESGIIHQMKKAHPEKTFYPAPSDETCGCSQCPYMRLNTIEKLYLCLRDETPEITLPEDLMVKALKPLARMLELS
ncbi:MAG: quinolinate synthase NadA [bacterium]|nr:quinolinate synthase NadA [bacterium]